MTIMTRLQNTHRSLILVPRTRFNKAFLIALNSSAESLLKILKLLKYLVEIHVYNI